MWIILLLFLALLMLSCPYWWRQFIIKRWRNILDLDTHLTTFRLLYANIDGFALSRKARSKHDDMEYVYGEIDFISFIALLSLVKPDTSTVFYDLGSGTGKAVFACAMVFNVKKCCGIELFNELHSAAVQQQRHLQHLSRTTSNYRDKVKRICFIQDDFLQADFKDATLIFINAAGFFGPTWQALNQRLEQLTSRLTVITTSKKLTSTAFTVIKMTQVQMSWGVVDAYIHRIKIE